MKSRKVASLARLVATKWRRWADLEPQSGVTGPTWSRKVASLGRLGAAKWRRWRIWPPKGLQDRRWRAGPPVAAGINNNIAGARAAEERRGGRPGPFVAVSLGPAGAGWRRRGAPGAAGARARQKRGGEAVRGRLWPSGAGWGRLAPPGRAWGRRGARLGPPGRARGRRGLQLRRWRTKDSIHSSLEGGEGDRSQSGGLEKNHSL